MKIAARVRVVTWPAVAAVPNHDADPVAAWAQVG